MSVLRFYFGWYEGAVYSNLLASLACVGAAWWRLRARMITHHLEQMAQHERHHAEMQAHVTATVAAAVPRPAPRRAKTLVTEPPKKAGA